MLELFLITYNRKENLENTLNQILAQNSPVRNLPLTILDNCSTDGTSEMLAEITKHHSNVKHIRHPKNIGGNANIARAFEMATAEYVWVLCDDDKFDFTAWDECQKLLEKKPAAVVVANYLAPQKGPEYLFRQLSFVPAAIYRTDLVTSTTMINMYFSIANIFPQLAVAASAVNRKQPMPILSTPLVTMQLNPGQDSYTRGTNITERVHPYMKDMFWSLGYLRSIQMLSDKNIRKKCSQLVWAEDYSSFYYFCRIWNFVCKKNKLAHYFESLYLLSGKAKWQFALFVPLSSPFFIYHTEKDIKICFFGKIKIRIWKYLK